MSAPLAIRAAVWVDAGRPQSTRSEALAWSIRAACTKPASVFRRGRGFVVVHDPIEWPAREARWAS